ncbi:MAG TPA: DUF2066 domain-containing protein [Rudaea sp.]
MVLILLVLATSAHAGGLYTVQVPVASQDEAERAQALKTGLGQVITRASGDPGALGRPEVAKALTQAERYVQQFQYQQDVVTESGQPQVRLTLIAQFDRDAVDRLLGSTSAAAEPAAAPAADTTPGTYHLWVGGVRSGRDYARVIGALSAVDSVRDVQVEQARGDGMQLRLATAGPLSRLLDALNAGSVMRVTNAKPPVEGLDALLDLKQ